MFRISIQETDDRAALTIEGKLRGPWVKELDRFWQDFMPGLRGRQLTVDLRGLMVVDDHGKRILKGIFEETGAALIADMPWTKHIVNEIQRTTPVDNGEESDHA